MRKRLNTIGNSVALVIDAPIRRQLGIGRNSIVELSTDGKCLIVEPLPPGTTLGERELPVSPERTLERDAPKIMRWLVERGLTRERWLDNPRVEIITPKDLEVIRRMQKCKDELAGGKTWDELIQSSISAGFFS